jgi:hypothetical protein
MALTATVGASGVMVEITGLQPGELPEFDYAYTPPGAAPEGFGVVPGERVGADGRAVDTTWLRSNASGSVPEVWDVRVIHARGVACTHLTLLPR